MKNIIVSLIVLFTIFSYAPNKVAEKPHVFKIGTKFTIALIKKGSKTYKLSILSEEDINYSVDYSETDSLFSPNPIAGTIEGVFAKGIDQEGPFKSVLIIRNNTKYAIDYKAKIAYNSSGKFYSTSISGLYPGAKSSELWNDKLTAIILHDFVKMK